MKQPMVQNPLLWKLVKKGPSNLWKLLLPLGEMI